MNVVVTVFVSYTSLSEDFLCGHCLFVCLFIIPLAENLNYRYSQKIVYMEVSLQNEIINDGFLYILTVANLFVTNFQKRSVFVLFT